MQISFSHLTRIRFHSLQIFSYFNIRNNIPFCRPSMHSIIFFQCPSENACQGYCIERNTRKSFHIPSSPGLAKTYHKNLSYKLSANPTKSPDQQHLDYPDDTYCIIIHDLMEYLLLQVILELYGISKDVSYIHFCFPVLYNLFFCRFDLLSFTHIISLFCRQHTVSTVLSLTQQSSCVSLSPKYTGKWNFMCFRNLPSGCSCS